MCPKPPSPRAVSGSAATGSHATRATGATTSCAIRIPGAITREDIARVLGEAPRDRDGDSPRASGTLASHYAPRARVIPVDDRSSLADALAVYPAAFVVDHTDGWTFFSLVGEGVEEVFAREANWKVYVQMALLATGKLGAGVVEKFAGL